MERIRGKRFGRAAMALAVALVVLGAGACSSLRRNDDSDGSSAGEAMVREDSAGGGAALPAHAAMSTGGSSGSSDEVQADEVGDVAATGNGPTSLPASVSQPRIVKTATLHVEVGGGSFSSAFSEAATIASSAGGFVASSTSAAGAGDDPASGSLTLRVPAERFDEVRDRLRKLGDLQTEELRGDDVGGQIADIEARLRNLRAQEEAIRALMARSTNVGETLQIQNQLSGVREQIEQLDGQRARLDDAVTFATLTLQLTEPGASTSPDGSRLGDAWRDAVDGAAAVLAGAIVALGYLVPVGLLLLAAYVVYRTAARRRPVTVVASTEHGA